MMALRAVLDNFALPRGQPSATLGALSLGEVGENVLRRRLKRREAVAMVERSPEYLQAKHLPGFDIPPPDPEDITISKRAWEHAHNKWKLSVRSLVGAECGPSICGGS